MTYFGREMSTDHPTGCTAMTWEDAEAIAKLNEENTWGFTDAELLHLVADYMDADKKHKSTANARELMSALREKEMIEWRLEDCNFHTLCKLLHDGKYTEAIKWIMTEMMD